MYLPGSYEYLGGVAAIKILDHGPIAAPLLLYRLPSPLFNWRASARVDLESEHPGVGRIILFTLSAASRSKNAFGTPFGKFSCSHNGRNHLCAAMQKRAESVFLVPVISQAETRFLWEIGCLIAAWAVPWQRCVPVVHV